MLQRIIAYLRVSTQRQGRPGLGPEAQRSAIDRFAETVIPVIASIQRTGITSLRGIALSLNDRGIRTARGGRWQVSNVRNVLARVALKVDRL